MAVQASELIRELESLGARRSAQQDEILGRLRAATAAVAGPVAPVAPPRPRDGSRRFLDHVRRLQRRHGEDLDLSRVSDPDLIAWYESGDKRRRLIEGEARPVSLGCTGERVPQFVYLVSIPVQPVRPAADDGAG